MQKLLRQHAEAIYKTAIKENMPNAAVKKAIEQLLKMQNEEPAKKGKIVLVSIGKAGWEMAKTAYEILGDKIHSGIVITKYDHVSAEYRMQNAKCKMEYENNGNLVGRLGTIEIYEAGHPVVDFNGICATKRALELTSSLCENDIVLFLVSGGGSALFESVDCPLEKMQELTNALLKCGANINEINTIRKHISNVKGGSFAKAVYPARVFAVVLSDVVGDNLSTIASGPACADATTVENCLEILEKYSISVDNEILSLIKRETPKEITNATHIVSGSVSYLCESARAMAQKLGYEAMVVDSAVTCDAVELAEKIGKLVQKDASSLRAYIFGGEITVKVTGNGKGGRNQELALRCAEKIKGNSRMAVFCVGSDGTDGPTDAAGGYVDGNTWEIIAKSGKSPEECLKNNDSYNALEKSNGLIFTGSTGTNVNDLYVLLCL